MNAVEADTTREPGRFSRWLLGNGRRQRADTQFTLIAMGVYAFSLLFQWQTVMAGVVEADLASRLTIAVVVIQLTLVALIRSGATRTLDDSGLVLAQMTIGILLIAWGYVINAYLNGTLLMLVTLVLSYSALSLSPRQCLAFGGFAVMVFAVVIVAAVQLAPAQFPP